MSIHYFETPSGAAITLGSTDQTLISAIHEWLAAQQSDHNSGKMNHCGVQM
jgi:hypothetical protein